MRPATAVQVETFSRVPLSVLFLAASLAGQSLPASSAAATESVALSISDENGVAVPDALVILRSNGARFTCRSDYAGRCRLRVPAGQYQLRAAREGFYSLELSSVDLSNKPRLELMLTHVQEVKERVDVVASAPAVDSAQTAAIQTLGTQEIVNIPFPTTRDIRYALPLVPGVVRDPQGQAHVAGGEAYQTLDVLDGFDITHPATGLLDLRFSADAVRSIDVESSRYSAEHGRASGGVVSFVTGLGDDRFRVSATNFVPSAQFKKGLNFDKWTPRATFSGPLAKRRAWFFLAPDFEYVNNIVSDLPDGADRNTLWRGSNLAKVQVNLTRANILTGNFLVNRFHSEHDGISPFNPQETTLLRNDSAWMYTVKDQHYFDGGTLLELGFAATRFNRRAEPLGWAPFVIRPEGNSGNYFKSTSGDARRLEGMANVYLPALHAAGRHELKFGVDFDRVSNQQRVLRRPISILREDGTLYSQIHFLGPPRFALDNLQSAAFLQDRWSPAERVLVEAGVRFDRDTIVSRNLLSPRLAATWMPTRSHTKLSAGLGVFYDATTLDLISRPLEGERLNDFYAADGCTLAGASFITAFHLDRHNLRAPRFLNWSVAVERELSRAVLLRAEFIEKRGRDGFTYINRSSTVFVGDYLLTNSRRDRYDAFQISMRKQLRDEHALMVSYTRSAARSNAVLDFTLDDPVFSSQAGGPLSWDAPDRLLSWGWLPVPRFRAWDVAYSLEWRDGFPFSVLDQNRRIVGAPNSLRFPDYFSLNLFLERRFGAIGHRWALRFGFENITGRRNPGAVNNNADSPVFLRFGLLSRRAFTARIRFLGRK